MNITKLLLVIGLFLLAFEPSLSDDQQDNLIAKISANFFDAEGPGLVYELTELGHAEDTARAMARAIADESGRCLYFAILEQSEAQSIDPGPYLDLFTVGLGDSEAAKLLEPEELGERARWCMLAARLEKGLQPQP